MHKSIANRKKIYLTLLIGVLLVGLTIAGIGITTKDKEIPTEEYNKLVSINSTIFEATNINCGLEYCDKVFIESSGGSKDFYVPEPYWINCTEASEEQE